MIFQDGYCTTNQDPYEFWVAQISSSTGTVHNGSPHLGLFFLRWTLAGDNNMSSGSIFGSWAAEQLSIPSQRDEEFKRCPQQILGTVVAVNSITGLYPQYTTTMYIYIYMNHPMIFPLNMIYSHIFPLYLSLVYDFGRCFLIGLCRFLAGAFFSQVWKVNLWISQWNHRCLLHPSCSFLAAR